jgi:hypothetical protein
MADQHPVPKAPPVRVNARGSEDIVNVDRMVRELNALCKSATLEFALAVGELVIRSLYAGDVDCFRSRARKHHAALRELATHPDLAMSASMLYGCIAIYELCERLDARSWQHVSTTHLRLVLPLQPDEQASLLREAEANRWPVRRLEEAVVACTKGRKGMSGRGGRPRRSPLRKSIKMLQKGLDAVAVFLRSEDRLEASPDSARAVASIVRRAVETCKVLENRMAAAAELPANQSPSAHAETAMPVASGERASRAPGGGTE